MADFWGWTTHDAVSFYTAVVALFTAILAASTIGLWIVSASAIRRQTKETQILQRAYLSVEPLGGELNRGGNSVLGQVGILNAGHLPAHKVRWFVKIKDVP